MISRFETDRRLTASVDKTAMVFGQMNEPSGARLTAPYHYTNITV
jgi:F0F1-type ATP synthase beta subunit